MTPDDPHKLQPIDGYGRQSEAEREDSESLDEQRDKWQAWCKMRGAPQGRWFQDANVSGAVAPQDRPGFAKALERIRSGESGGVVVHDLSRLSRGAVGPVLELIRTINDEHGARIVILDIGGESVDPTTPTGEAILTVLLARSRMEWRMTAAKIETGKLRAARAGKCMGVPELGYDLDENGYRVPNGDAKLVSDIFERVIANGVPETLHWLGRDKGEGADPAREWSRTWLRRVLARQAYHGVSEWNGITVEAIPDGYVRAGEPPHKAIVDFATWTRANTRAGQTEQVQRRSAKREYPLTKFTVCAECHKPLRGTLSGVVKGSEGVRAYRGYCEHGVYVRADDLERAVYDVLIDGAAEHEDPAVLVADASADVAEAERALSSAKLARQRDATNLDLDPATLKLRDAAHAERIGRLEAAYAAALSAAQPVRRPSIVEEIERGGIAGLPNELRNMYDAGAVVTVKPGSKLPARERIFLEERSTIREELGPLPPTARRDR